MGANKNVQFQMHTNAYDRLKQFAKDEGIIGSITGKPIVSQTVVRTVRMFLQVHEDADWKEIREQFGGSTFSMIETAIANHLKQIKKGQR